MTLLQHLRRHKPLGCFALCLFIAVNPLFVAYTQSMGVALEEIAVLAAQHAPAVLTALALKTQISDPQAQSSIYQSQTQTQSNTQPQAQPTIDTPQTSPRTHDTVPPKPLFEPQPTPPLFITPSLNQAFEKAASPSLPCASQASPTHTTQTESRAAGITQHILNQTSPASTPKISPNRAPVAMSTSQACIPITHTQSKYIPQFCTQTLSSTWSQTASQALNLDTKTAPQSLSIPGYLSPAIPFITYKTPLPVWNTLPQISLSKIVAPAMLIGTGIWVTQSAFQALNEVNSKLCNRYNRAVDFEEDIREHPQQFAAYRSRIDSFIDTLIQACDTYLHVSQRYRALLEINDCNLPGIWGENLRALVRKINCFYFDTDGNLTSFVRSDKSRRKIKRLLFDFFINIAHSQRHLANCLRFTKARNFRLACSCNTENIVDNFKPRNNDGPPSLLSYWWDCWWRPQQKAVLNNKQNRAYLKFISYCTIDPTLSRQTLANALAIAKEILRKQEHLYPNSLTTKQMDHELCQAYNHLSKLPIYTHTPTVDNPRTQVPHREQQLPGAPPFDPPLPLPNLPAPGVCGKETNLPDLNSGPDIISPGDTIKPRACNFSQSYGIPAFDIAGEVTNGTPQPGPDHDNTTERSTQPIIPAVEDKERSIPASDSHDKSDSQAIEIRPATTQKKKEKIAQKSFAQQLEEVHKNLFQERAALQEQACKALAEAGSPEERSAIEKYINQAIEKCNTQAQAKLDRIHKAQATAYINKIKKAQQALEKEKAAKGLTLENLPEIKIENFDERICDHELLRILIERYRHFPGVLNTDGPLTRIIKMGLKGCKDGQLNRAEGAVKELLTADTLDLKEIIAFDKESEIPQELYGKLGLDSKRVKVEFDIETQQLLIEVKSGQWKEFDTIEMLKNYNLDILSKLNEKELAIILKGLARANTDTYFIDTQAIENVHKTLKNFLVQKEVAKLMNKKFILVYFNELPLPLKLWLEKECINFTRYKKYERLSY